MLRPGGNGSTHTRNPHIQYTHTVNTHTRIHTYSTHTHTHTYIHTYILVLSVKRVITSVNANPI